MRPLDKVFIENWFVCSPRLITSCLHCQWSTQTGAHCPQERLVLGSGMGMTVTLAVFLPHPPHEAFFLLLNRHWPLQAGLSLPFLLPPYSAAVILRWGQDAGQHLLPPFCQRCTAPNSVSCPLLCFQPHWAKPLPFPPLGPTWRPLSPSRTLILSSFLIAFLRNLLRTSSSVKSCDSDLGPIIPYIFCPVSLS